MLTKPLLKLDLLREYLYCPLKARYISWVGSRGSYPGPEGVFEAAIRKGLKTYLDALSGKWVDEKNAIDLGAKAYQKFLSSYPHLFGRYPWKSFDRYYAGIATLNNVRDALDDKESEYLYGDAVFVIDSGDYQVEGRVLGIARRMTSLKLNRDILMIDMGVHRPFPGASEILLYGYFHKVAQLIMDNGATSIRLMLINVFDSTIYEVSLSPIHVEYFDTIVASVGRAFVNDIFPPQAERSKCSQCRFLDRCDFRHSGPDAEKYKEEFSQKEKREAHTTIARRRHI